jgi:hypothetical protein
MRRGLSEDLEMKVTSLAAAPAVLALVLASPASAQFLPFPPAPPPLPALCPGPFGPVPCGLGAPLPPPFATPPFATPPFVPPPMPFPPPGAYPGIGAPPPGMPGPAPAGIPPAWQAAARAAGVPNDGLIMAQIGQQCGPEPSCWAARWAPVELSRCAGGIGVEGGCFGPNGEIMRILTRPDEVIEDLGTTIGDAVCNLFGC